MSIIFLLCGTGIFLVLFYIYPIVSYASEFLHSSCYSLNNTAKLSLGIPGKNAGERELMALIGSDDQVCYFLHNL